MKINYSIPEEVLEKVDNRAKQLGISRSAFITMTLSEKLEQSELIRNIPLMLKTMETMPSNERK